MKRHLSLTLALALGIAAQAAAPMTVNRFAPAAQLTSAQQRKTDLNRKQSERRQAVETSLAKHNNLVKPAHTAMMRLIPEGASTYNIVDDGTRLNFNIYNWFEGDFIGIGSTRPIDNGGLVQLNPFEPKGDGYTYDVSLASFATNGVYANGKYYGTAWGAGGGAVYQAEYFVYDAETWTLEKNIRFEDPQYYLVPLFQAYNPMDNKVWAITHNAYGYPEYLSTLNPEEGTYTQIVSGTFDDISGITFTADGTMLAVSKDRNLYAIQTGDGSREMIMTLTDTEWDTHREQILAMDYHTNTLYWLQTTDWFELKLHTIDLEAKTVTTVSNYPWNFLAGGAWITSASAPGGDKAPAAVSAIDIAYREEGGKTADITVAAPLTAFDGSEMTEAVTLAMTIDGASVGSNLTVQPGEEARFEGIEFPGSGLHTVAVTPSNTIGQGTTGSVKSYTGSDTPDVVANVALTVDDNGKVTLAWDAPTRGANDGFFPADNLSYDIVRMPGNVEVAKALTATSFTEQLPDVLDRYSYIITAEIDGLKSEPVTSPSKVFGPGIAELPWKMDLNTPFFNLCDVYDMDGDTYTFYETWGSLSTASGYMAAEPSLDWLITPPFALQPGNYMLTIEYGNIEGSPILSVAHGSTPSPDDMQILATYSGTTYADGNQRRSVYFTVNEAGKHYIGIKYDGPVLPIEMYSMNYITIYDLALEQGPKDTAPGALTALSGKPAPNGELKTTLTFTTPTVDFKGNAVTGLTDVEIVNAEGTTIGTVPATEAGKEYSFTDENAAQGYNDYVLYARNADGRGVRCELSVYAGPDYADAVTLTSLSITDNRTVNLSWTAPGELGINGGYVNPAELTYNFCRSSYEGQLPFSIIFGLKDTQYSYTEEGDYAGSMNSQAIYSYGITAQNTLGEGRLGYFSVVLGRPYSAPWRESFANGWAAMSPWSLQQLTGSAAWEMPWTPVVDAYDNDYGVIQLVGTDDETSSSAIVTPVLTLEGMVEPVIEFAMYHTGDVSDQAWLNLQASSNDGQYIPLEGATTVHRVNDGTEGWSFHTVSLKAVNGSDRVQVAFLGNVAGQGDYIVLDAIRAYDNVPVELALNNASAPAEMAMNKPAEISVNITNRGADDITDYTLTIAANGITVASMPGETAILSGESIDLQFEVNPTAALVSDKVEFTVTLVAEGDANPDNNIARLTASVRGSDLPAPTALTGVADVTVMNLSWTAPAADAPAVVEESFEDYEPFAITSQGLWQFIDRDGNAPYGIANVEYPNMSAPRAFMVWAPDEIALGDMAWNPRSGSQCLIAFSADMWTADGGFNYIERSDDWLVSPHVIGGTTVKFYAGKPSMGSAIENFRFMVSTTGNAPEDFTLVDVEKELTEVGWVEYEFTLPEDAQYFAVNYTSSYQFALMFDDFSFTAGYNGLTLVGYNLYINGELQNEDPLTATETIAAITADMTDVTYAVSAVYEQGESSAVTWNWSKPDALGSIGTTGIKVIPGVGSVTVTGADSRTIDLYDPAGRHVASVIGSDNTVINVPAGLYLVKVAGTRTAKVAVK